MSLSTLPHMAEAFGWFAAAYLILTMGSLVQAALNGIPAADGGVSHKLRHAVACWKQAGRANTKSLLMKAALATGLGGWALTGGFLTSGRLLALFFALMASRTIEKSATGAYQPSRG